MLSNSKLGFGLMRLPKDESGSIELKEVNRMVDSFMEMMDDGGAYIGVELKPEEMCTEAYAVKNHLEIF